MSDEYIDYNNLLDIKVEVAAELGSTKLSLKDILRFERGTVIDLNRPAGNPCDIRVNNRYIGRAEVMVYEKNFAIRINSILKSGDFIEKIKEEI